MLKLIPYPKQVTEGEGTVKTATDEFGAPKYERVYDEGMAAENYELTVADNGAKIRAGSQSGFIYGETTLNLLTSSAEPIAATRICDGPKWAWRGYMLDVSRYFFSVDDVKKQIDFMAVLKLNVLHLHLTDDQGWRVEIKKYPRLTEVGAWRRRTLFRLKRHGGYYTQEELKEIVSYAHANGIKVVPEIEFPGHFTAVIAAYPELGCYGKGVKVAENFGVKYDVACLGNPQVMQFVKDVLSELFPIFTDEYYHIGGDEVLYQRYELCPKCRKAKEEAGAKSWAELQARLVNEIAAFLNENGKRAITWNEAVPSGKVDKSIIWQYWQGGLDESALVTEINAGRQVIISSRCPYYLDLPYATNTLRAIAEYRDVPQGADPEKVLGLEFALWTELVPDQRNAEKKMFPRLALMAEKAWRGEVADDFPVRYTEIAEKLIALGADIPEKLKMPPKGIAAVIDKIWFNRSQLYWGAITNLIGNIKATVAAKKQNREMEDGTKDA